MQSGKDEKIISIQNRIQFNATSFGNKTANLIELETFLKNISNDNIHCQIPPIFPISHESIQNHLDKYAPDWRNIWEQFIENQQNEKTNTLHLISKELLKKLQDLILKTFKAHPFQSPTTIPENDIFMVRSSGEEDTIDMANPGGNESVASVRYENITDAIGIVVASYFSEKSILQRLLSGDDILKTPFTPVLIQKMIAEKLHGEDNPKKVFISGVIYAENPWVRIDAAPGHGEMIVNGKGAFDTYDITRDDNVHPIIQVKKSRLVPNNDDKKSHLTLKENPIHLQINPSFSTHDALDIAKIARKISAHYGIPMDIEFIFDPHTSTLHIVQARPIPKKSQKTYPPSSIAPTHWAQIKMNDKIPKIKIMPITKDLMTAKIITSSDQIILQNHLTFETKDYKNTKAIIIKEPSPSTSHEAAVFNALGIPILQTKNIDTIVAWLKESSPQLIIDPQRQHIVNWTHEEKCDELIMEGIFASVEKPNKTLLPINQSNPAMREIIETYLSSDEKIDKSHKNIYTKANDAISLLEIALPNSNNENAFAALQTLAAIFKSIGTSSNAKEPYQPHQRLLVASILSIAEIHLSLLRLKNGSITQTEYLSVVNKLKALVINPDETGLYLSSIQQIALKNKSEIITQDLKLNHSEKAFYIELKKLESLALYESTKNDWNTLIRSTLTDENAQEKIKKIILLSAQYNILSELINDIFVKNRALDQLETCILEYIKELNQYHIHNNHLILESWKSRIHEWSNPEKFARLFIEFEKDFNFCTKSIDLTSENISIKKTMLNQMLATADLLDKTIKNMKGSPENKDRKLVIERFIKLLQLYHDLMQKCLNAIPDELYDEWKKNIVFFPEMNSKIKMLENITRIFYKCASSNRANLLEPSNRFSVATARVGSTASFYRQFVQLEDLLTLEDLFTFFHQNILSSIAILKNEKLLKIDDLPPELSQLLKPLQSSSIDLLSIKHEPPLVIFDYNYPMRNHSMQIKLSYHLKDKNVELCINAFGTNFLSRMSDLKEVLPLEAKILNAYTFELQELHGQSIEAVMKLSNKDLPFLSTRIEKMLNNYNLILSVDASPIGYLRFLECFGKDVERINSLTEKETLSILNKCIDNKRFDLAKSLIETHQALSMQQDELIGKLSGYPEMHAFLLDLIKKWSHPDSISQWTSTYIARTHFPRTETQPDHLFKLLLPHIDLSYKKDQKTLLECFIYYYQYNKNLSRLPLLLSEEKLDYSKHPQTISLAAQSQNPDLLRFLIRNGAPLVMNFYAISCLMENKNCQRVIQDEIGLLTPNQITHFIYGLLRNGYKENTISFTLSLIEQFLSKIDFCYKPNDEKQLLIELILDSLKDEMKRYDFLVNIEFDNVIERIPPKDRTSFIYTLFFGLKNTTETQFTIKIIKHWLPKLNLNFKHDDQTLFELLIQKVEDEDSRLLLLENIHLIDPKYLSLFLRSAAIKQQFVLYQAIIQHFTKNNLQITDDYYKTGQAYLSFPNEAFAIALLKSKAFHISDDIFIRRGIEATLYEKYPKAYRMFQALEWTSQPWFFQTLWKNVFHGEDKNDMKYKK